MSKNDGAFGISVTRDDEGRWHQEISTPGAEHTRELTSAERARIQKTLDEATRDREKADRNRKKAAANAEKARLRAEARARRNT